MTRRLAWGSLDRCVDFEQPARRMVDSGRHERRTGMSRDRDPKAAPTPTDAAEVDATPAMESHAFDSLLGVGSAHDVAAAIVGQPAAERDELLARVHRLRGNRFAVEVEAELL